MERRISFDAKIVPVAPINQEFTLAKCYVMATGANRNGSFITEDAVNNALPTLYNLPVIAHLYEDEDGEYHVGGHDMKVVKNKDGGYDLKSVCVPFGVVPERPDEISYEDLEEPGRGVKKYLTTPVVLWTGRYPELKEAFRDGGDVVLGQSMEINVFGHEPNADDPNYENITDFSFSALCLLGDATPCFPRAGVEPYEFSLDDKFTELMSQLKEELSVCFNNAGKGGECMTEDEKVVMQDDEISDNEVSGEVHCSDNQENVDNSSINCDGNSNTSEEFKDDGGAEAETRNDSVFSSTYKEKRDAIENALPHFVETDEGGGVVRGVNYWLCDFDDTHAFVEKSEYTRDNGCSETKGRFAYVYEEGSSSATISGDFEEMFVRWLTREEVEQIERNREEYETLVEYRLEREKSDREFEFDEAIKKFSDLEDNAEYAEVYKNRYAYESVKSLEDACYIIRGKYAIPAPQRKNNSDASVPVGAAVAELSVRERFHEKYGKKN